MVVAINCKEGQLSETLSQLILIEDALESSRLMTKDSFLSATKDEHQSTHALAWDEAQRLVKQYGSWKKALNHIRQEIEKYRT